MNQRTGWLVKLLLLGLAVCSLPPRSFAVEFRPANTYSVGSSPTSLAIGDFNGDGKPDIAVANSGSNDVSVLLGRGDGTFHASVSYAAGLSPSQVLVVDFNGDNKPDLVLFQPGDGDTNAGKISVLLGNGDGTFQAPKVSTLTASVMYMAAGDFNGDKKADLVVSSSDLNSGALTLEILIGSGDGTFQASKSVPSNIGNINFAVADFNHDGKLDLAINTGNTVQLLLGDGDGAFQTGGTATAAENVDGFVIADVDNDNQPDLIVFSSVRTTGPGPCHVICPTTVTQHVTIFFNNNGVLGGAMVFFSGGESFTTGTNLISQILPGEFNGDAKTDLASTRTRGGFGIQLGRGDRTFSVAAPLSLDVPVAVAHDLNGDKLDDLVGLDSENNAVVVLVNDSPTSGADMAIATAGQNPNPVGVGMPLSYSADILNEGPEGATNVIFTDALPQGVNFVSATSTQGNCSQTNRIVTCNLGSLASTADVSITISATPTAPATLINNMNVSATEADLTLANNSATQTDTVLPTYVITVTKTGAGSGTVNGSWGVGLGNIKAFSCGATCSPGFVSGAVVHLSATADSNSTFQSWGGACSGGSATCDLTMSADMAVTATFEITPDFVVTPASTSLSVTRGSQVSEPLTFPAQGGFSGTIALTCSVTGPVPVPTCGISPNSVTPGNTATLTINAAGLSAGLAPPSFAGQAAPYLATLPFAGLGFFLLAGEPIRKRRSTKILALAVFALAILLGGCSGGSSSSPPPVKQTYNVTVTGTSGNIAHSTTINVIVN